MSWANSVLPIFTGDSSEKLRIAPDQVQIDTNHFRPQTPAKSGLSRTPLAINRTAVDCPFKRKPLNRRLLVRYFRLFQQLDCERYLGTVVQRKTGVASVVRQPGNGTSNH
jgi:hypothetical protein